MFPVTEMTVIYPYGRGDAPVKWVSTEWLAGHLGDRDLMILDCQPNIHEYIQDHIPGAVDWHEGLFRIHEGPIPTRWIPRRQPDPVRDARPGTGETGRRALSSGPLSACATFIGDGLEQTMVAYTLARYGHREVYILDGGFEKWKEENRPLTREYGVTKPSVFRDRPNRIFHRV